MKKVFIIIGVIIFIGIIFLNSDYFLEEKYNEDPCDASGNLMIERLKSEYDILTWSSTPKNFC